jgi:hypothetical protein
MVSGNYAMFRTRASTARKILNIATSRVKISMRYDSFQISRQLYIFFFEIANFIFYCGAVVVEGHEDSGGKAEATAMCSSPI